VDKLDNFAFKLVAAGKFKTNGARRLSSRVTDIPATKDASPTEANAKGFRQCLNFDLDVSQ
jgi:hypothetical protein